MVSLIKNLHHSRWLTPEQARNLWLKHLISLGVEQDGIPDYFWTEIRRTTFPENNLSRDDIDVLDGLVRKLFLIAAANSTLLAILIVMLFIERAKRNQKPNVTVINSKDVSINGSTIDKSKEEIINLTEETENIVSVGASLGAEGLFKPILIAIHSPSQKALFVPKIFDYISQDTITPLLAGTTSGDPNDRSMAINYLSYFPENEDAIKAILYALSDLSPLVRGTAADVIGERKIPNAEKKLIELIENPEELLTVKNLAAVALAEIGTPQAIKFLIDAVKMPWEDFTLKQIIKANPHRILRPIIKEFSHQNRQKNLAFSHILIAYPSATIDVCVDLLKSHKDKDLLATSLVLEMVLDIAWDTLEANQIKKIIRNSEYLLNHESFTLRYHAIRILGRIRNQDCIHLLIQSVAHNDVNTRAFAAYYLEHYRANSDALKSLIRAYEVEKDKKLKGKIGDLLGNDRPKTRYEKWFNTTFIVILGLMASLYVGGTLVAPFFCNCSTPLSMVPHPYSDLILFASVLSFVSLLYIAIMSVLDVFKDDKDEDLFWKVK
jgi:HEAT repeat protein